MDRSNEVLEQIITDPHDPNIGSLINELLGAFCGGYPLEHLRCLLLDRRPEIVEIGTWVASELGSRGQSLLGDIVLSLKHPSKRVRFFAIDCVLSWSTQQNGSEIASVLSLIDDNETAVRWKVMDFLSRSSREQLQGALVHLSAASPNSKHIVGLEWLLGENGKSPDGALSFIQNPDDILRKYGAAAAVRMSNQTNGPLLYCASVEDPDVRQFAIDMLKIRNPDRI